MKASKMFVLECRRLDSNCSWEKCGVKSCDTQCATNLSLLVVVHYSLRCRWGCKANITEAYILKKGFDILLRYSAIRTWTSHCTKWDKSSMWNFIIFCLNMVTFTIQQVYWLVFSMKSILLFNAPTIRNLDNIRIVGALNNKMYTSIVEYRGYRSIC